MGVDLDVLIAATLTAEEAFALPERLSSSLAVAAARRAYYDAMKPHAPGLELRPWQWHELWPAITGPSSIVEIWDDRYLANAPLLSTPGLLWLGRDQIRFHPGPKLSGFACDYEGCQVPIRRVCRALARELGADRVLYLPDSGDWAAEVGDLSDRPFDEALARLTAWGPPVSSLGALGYGRAVRDGFHYADGALRRADGTAVPDEEIVPGRNRIWSGGIARYRDGTLVPAEELARPDLRGGFAYYVDDFHDLA